MIVNDGEDRSPVYLKDGGKYPFVVASHNETVSKSGNELHVMILQISENGRTYDVRDNLTLVPQCEGVIASFLRCVGIKKHGEQIDVTGATFERSVGLRGTMVIKHEKYTKKDNTQGTAYRVKYYIDKQGPQASRVQPEPPMPEQEHEDVPF